MANDRFSEFTPDDILDTYGRWKDGLCPCCGGPIEEYPRWSRDIDPATGLHMDGLVQPRAIAEGVMFCGRCIAMDHHETETAEGERLVEMILRALVLGNPNR